jgi:hypothetical protein
LREKYQCPEDAFIKLDISPEIQNEGKLCSRSSLTKWLISLTEKILASLGLELIIDVELIKLEGYPLQLSSL